MNNTVLGMVRQWQKLFYENRFADTDPHRATDFVKVAEGFGVKALRIVLMTILMLFLKKRLNITDLFWLIAESALIPTYFL